MPFMLPSYRLHIVFQCVGLLDKGDVMYDVCAFKIGWEAPIERVRKLSGNVKEEQTPPDKTEKQKQND